MARSGVTTFAGGVEVRLLTGHLVDGAGPVRCRCKKLRCLSRRVVREPGLVFSRHLAVGWRRQ